MSDVHIAAGTKLARFMFAKRGNHSEIHLSEVELAAALAVAFQLGQAKPPVAADQKITALETALQGIIERYHDGNLTEGGANFFAREAIDKAKKL